jgi:hypothetical protein
VAATLRRAAVLLVALLAVLVFMNGGEVFSGASCARWSLSSCWSRAVARIGLQWDPGNWFRRTSKWFGVPV